jgi:hypothetical protein
VNADPDRAASILDHVGDVTLVYWLLGSARGEPAELQAIHGPRLERLLESLVDTPVRGFVYEAAGTAAAEHLERGRAATSAAAERWRIPVRIVTADPGDVREWLAAMSGAADWLLRGS